jgi:hypothetical protein
MALRSISLLDLLKPSADALDVVTALCRMHPQVARVSFLTYAPSLGLEERLRESHPVLRPLFDKATQLRAVSEQSMPYWESVLVAAWSGPHLNLMLTEALRHDHEREPSRRFDVGVEEINREYLRRTASQLPPGMVLGLTSACWLRDGSIRHIPMMDFRVIPQSREMNSLQMALETLGILSGIVLESGRSYHIYGSELLDPSGWIQFMSKCLLIAPIVDARYIAHRLIEGSCVLRLTATDRKPKIPTVVHVF